MDVLIRKALLLLCKFIPSDFVVKSQKQINEAINLIDKEYFKDPSKLIQPICKIIPVEIIQKNPLVIETVYNIIKNRQYKSIQQINLSLQEIYQSYQNQKKKQTSNFTEQDFANAEEAIDFFVKNIANNPQKLVEYLFTFSLEIFKSCCESINDLKKLDILDKLASIEASKDVLAFGRSNPDYMKPMFTQTLHQLFEIYRQLESRFIFYLDKIKELDNQSAFQFYLFSGPVSWLKGDIDTNNQIAKYSVEGMRQAVNMQIIISHYLQVDIQSSVLHNFEEFTRYTLTDEICDLLQAYEKNQEEQYWFQLPNECKQTLDSKNLLLDYIK